MYVWAGSIIQSKTARTAFMHPSYSAVSSYKLKRKNDDMGCDVSGYFCCFLPVPHCIWGRYCMVAARVKENMKIKYSNLDSYYIFAMIAFETSGIVGAESMALLREIWRWLQETTMDDMAFTHFLQRHSVAVQQHNAASVVGTVTAESCSDFFDIPLTCVSMLSCCC